MSVTALSTHRFLAAPKPPGNTTASNESAFNSEREEMEPLAIRADSTSTFL